MSYNNPLSVEKQYFTNIAAIQNVAVLQQIWLYEIIGGTLPMCQKTTMRVYGAWIKSPGRVLPLWRLLLVFRHFEPPFSGLWKICIVLTHILSKNRGKCRISTPIFWQNLATCIVSIPFFALCSSAEHPYPKPNWEPPWNKDVAFYVQ